MAKKEKSFSLDIVPVKGDELFPLSPNEVFNWKFVNYPIASWGLYPESWQPTGHMNIDNGENRWLFLRIPIAEYLTIEFYQSALEKQFHHLSNYYRDLGLADFMENKYLFQQIVMKILIDENDYYQNLQRE